MRYKTVKGDQQDVYVQTSQIVDLLDSGVLSADGDHGLLELLPDPGHGEEVGRPHLAQRVDQAPLEGVLVREVDGKSPSMNLFNKLFKVVGRRIR